MNGRGDGSHGTRDPSHGLDTNEFSLFSEKQEQLPLKEEHWFRNLFCKADEMAMSGLLSLLASLWGSV